MITLYMALFVSYFYLKFVLTQYLYCSFLYFTTINAKGYGNIVSATETGNAGDIGTIEFD